MSIKGITDDKKIAQSMLEHIFLGEDIKGKVKGYHHEGVYSDSVVIVHKYYSRYYVRNIVTENKDKHLYEAVVKSRVSGIHKNRNGGRSTFFNRDWSSRLLIVLID